MDEIRRFGPVQLRLPAEPELARVARLAASGLASLDGCSLDEIEDIKIAVSEVLIVLIEHGEGARIDLQLDVTPDGFHVTGRAPIAEFDLEHPDLALCRTVLEAVCTRHEIALDNGLATIDASIGRTSGPATG